MTFTGSENHDISFTDAAKFTKRYRDQMGTEDRLGGFFGEEAISAVLAQDGCIGIRYYYGLDENRKQVLVIVGVDENENDLVGDNNIAINLAIPCPAHCSTDNMLNH